MNTSAAEPRVPALNCDHSTEASQETSNEVDKESAESLNDAQTEVPVKRKRGRPRKRSVEIPNDDGSPVVKRPRGRPKGSKNKHPRPKPIPTGPKRPRGRPRKWPPRDASAPKRGRGRPRKHTIIESESLPTMVQVPGTTVPPTSPSATVSSPVIAGPVPPDDLFASDETDSLPGSFGDFIHLTNQFPGTSHT